MVNGIYAFKGQGPHFPRKIFIYRDKKIFFFQSVGAYNPNGIIKEYSTFLSENKLTNAETIMYLRAIYEYLKDEKFEEILGIINSQEEIIKNDTNSGNTYVFMGAGSVSKVAHEIANDLRKMEK